jgi:type IV secretion system protein VirB4
MTILDHITPGLVVLDDGALFALLELECVSADTTDLNDLNWLTERLNLTYRNIATMRPEITIYDCRGYADRSLYPGGKCPNALVESIDHAYRDLLLDASLYSHRVYFGIHIPTQYLAGDFLGARVSRWQRRRRRNAEPPLSRIETLESLVGQLMTELKPYRPKRLSTERRGRVLFSQIAEALAYAFTGIWRQVPVPVGYGDHGKRHHSRLANVIITEQIIVGREAVEMRGNGYSVFAAAFALREYPSETWPGMFSALLVGRYCRTIVHTFTILLGADAQALISRKQNRMVNAEDKAYSQIAGLTVLGNHLQNNDLVLGLHTMVVLGFGDSLDTLNAVANDITSDLASCGAVVIRERRALEAALFSIWPGAGKLRVRPGTISSANFAAMMPFHGYPTGARKGRWGDPVAVFRSLAGTPIFFHWAVGLYANGNTLLTGEAGSGKSLATGFLIAMSSKVAGILALDNKRGWETLFRGMGAPYAVLGNGKPFFAPLKALDNSDESIEFLTRLIRSAIMQGDTFEPSDEESRRLVMGLRSVMTLPPAERWMEDVRAYLGANAPAAGRLQKWCWGEELGWVIDAPRDIINMESDLNCFDITEIMKNPRASGPAIFYIMQRISMRLDGRPFLIPIDEGWLVVNNATFAPLIFDLARRIRSLGGVLVFITQSPSDAAKAGIAEAMVEQFPNQIHMANPRAQKHHYVDGLKRTEREYEIIRRLPPEQGMFLLAQGNRTVVGQLLMTGLDDVMMTLSTPQDLLELLDESRDMVGDDPQALLAEYHRRRKEKVIAP